MKFLTRLGHERYEGARRMRMSDHRVLGKKLLINVVRFLCMYCFFFSFFLEPKRFRTLVRIWRDAAAYCYCRLSTVEA